MSERILVVGATGFVGSHIARCLVQERHDVHGLGKRGSVDLLHDVAAKVQLHPGDLTHPADIDAVMAEVNPQTVIWSAGHNANAQGLMASGDADFAGTIQTNVNGWTNVLQAAQSHSVQRVFAAGSTVVFGPSNLYAPERVDESAPMRPATVYGLTKAMAEQAAQYFRDRYGLAVTTMRLPLVFGPGRWYGGVAAAFNRLLDEASPGKTLNFSAPIDRFDLIYVKDVACAMAAAVASTKPLAPVYHLNGFTTTYPAIVLVLKDLIADLSINFSPAPTTNVYPLMSAAKIAADLGFRPEYDLVAALQDYLSQRNPPP